ncbi:hypothetical protein DY000_02023454 [Brassica cretica]|uniref:Uncharacterized protein n=1 Tax=Brassica cretica TaxID=69181 RepID=A0ABQ7E9W0_BRACR|nr:hypothetical protein DY000_02023454 [Brassica cretica]
MGDYGNQEQLIAQSQQMQQQMLQMQHTIQAQQDAAQQAALVQQEQQAHDKIDELTAKVNQLLKNNQGHFFSMEQATAEQIQNQNQRQPQRAFGTTLTEKERQDSQISREGLRGGLGSKGLSEWFRSKGANWLEVNGKGFKTDSVKGFEVVVEGGERVGEDLERLSDGLDAWVGVEKGLVFTRGLEGREGSVGTREVDEDGSSTGVKATEPKGRSLTTGWGSREVSETVTDDVTELVTMRASRRNPRVVDRKFHNFNAFPLKLDHLSVGLDGGGRFVGLTVSDLFSATVTEEDKVRFPCSVSISKAPIEVVVGCRFSVEAAVTVGFNSILRCPFREAPARAVLEVESVRDGNSAGERGEDGSGGSGGGQEGVHQEQTPKDSHRKCDQAHFTQVALGVVSERV